MCPGSCICIETQKTLLQPLGRPKPSTFPDPYTKLQIIVKSSSIFGPSLCLLERGIQQHCDERLHYNLGVWEEECSLPTYHMKLAEVYCLTFKCLTFTYFEKCIMGRNGHNLTFKKSWRDQEGINLADMAPAQD